MRKHLYILMFLMIFLLSGCGLLFNEVADSIYQNIEIDHFEEVIEGNIELYVGSNELPDFKVYMNRVTPEGTTKAKSSFDVETIDLDIDTVGSYQVQYHFTSLDTLIEYEITVEVIKRPVEDVIELIDYVNTINSIHAQFALVTSEYEIDIIKIELYKEVDGLLIEERTDVVDPSTIEFSELLVNSLYTIRIHFEDGSSYDFTGIETLAE